MNCDKKSINYAFIDSQNVNLAIRNQGWILDFKRFFVYIKDKYQVSKAFLFIGFIPDKKNLYDYLKKIGYIIIFKPTIKHILKDKIFIKGNVDAELVLQAMIEFNNYDQAIIVSGDGDFYCLIKYLIQQKKLKRLLIPNLYKYSALLRNFIDYIDFINGLEKKVGKQKRGINLRTKP